MAEPNSHSTPSLARDLVAGLVVFLVALPLCLGIALASNVPLFSGILAGIIGGIVVGSISGSQASVSGPAAGLTAIVAAQIVTLGDFRTFLLAVLIAGVMQLALGIARAGFIAAFFPTSVIKGLLAAIGVILILKQIPHVFGHDTDPEGEMSFQQPDHETTLSEFADLPFDVHLGAAVIGLVSVALLLTWDRVKPLKKSLVPGPLVVVLLGVVLQLLFQRLGGPWVIQAQHLVQVPAAANLTEFVGFLQQPDFSQWTNPAVYVAGATIALVASLETLLNLEAVDDLDPKQRTSPASRELVAQGIGNMTAGLLGAIPITSVIVRSSVNLNAGAETKLSAIFHGVLLAICAVFMPAYLNQIPLSCLAAILLVTGCKLASLSLVREMWSQGRYQFTPFAVTVVAIVLTDLLVGIVIGLLISLGFILNSNLRRPIRRVVEKHLGGEVFHIELANQVSFLNRAALSKLLDSVPRGTHLLLDALNTDYIDPDVLSVIRSYRDHTAPAHGVEVSLVGFRNKYQLDDQIQYVDYSTRELQDSVSPQQVLQILMDGNQRFRTGRQLTRHFSRQVQNTASGQHPLAVVLSCIDSRAPAEIVFDTGLGDIFSIRIAGNITSHKVLGSIEYCCVVAGAKLILVMGHTRCGAVTSAVQLASSEKSAVQATGCHHAQFILDDIQHSIDTHVRRRLNELSPVDREAFVNEVATRNVVRSVASIREQSPTIGRLIEDGKIALVGAMYDISTGCVRVLA